MDNNTFTYQYSAERNKEIESIRKRYMPKEESKLETMKKLDCRVKSAGIIESLCLGIIGALVFGIGMCFFLDVFAGGAWIAVLFFIFGAALMLPAYPVYKKISLTTKERLTPQILRLCDEIMKSQN